MTPEDISGHRLILGDCREAMAAMPENSIDAIVCDPPYGMSAEPDAAEVLSHWLAGDDYHHGGGGFMGKKWDSFVPGPSVWREAARVLKPGGWCIAFSSTRTSDLLGIAMRLAKLERRDTCAWIYYSGFPKSLALDRAIDSKHGAEREIVSKTASSYGYQKSGERWTEEHYITAPATEDARRFAGYGTALKPSHEPALIFRKPMIGTYAENALQWGTGGLNIDRARFAYGDQAWPGDTSKVRDARRSDGSLSGGTARSVTLPGRDYVSEYAHDLGRWPANIYATPKASTAERNAGCEQLTAITGAEATNRTEGSAGLENPRAGAGRTADQVANFHPTLKPLAVLRYFVRLVTPPAIPGKPPPVILDPFAGSGSLACAAAAERVASISIEIDPDYHRIARARIERATRQGDLFAM